MGAEKSVDLLRRTKKAKFIQKINEDRHEQ